MDASQNTTQPSDSELEINQRFARRLIANRLVIRQGVAGSVETNELTMRQAVAGKIGVDQLQANASAVGLLQAQSAQIENSTLGVAHVAGNVSLDQSGSYALVTSGPVEMDQSGSAVTVAKSVVMKNSGTVFLFAQHVEGDVNTLFDSRDAVIFGAMAGLVGGLVMLLGRIFRRRR